jgi:hypothetical protein
MSVPRFAAVLLTLGLGLPGGLQAQPSDQPPVVETPPLPEQVQSGEVLEPEVTILRGEREVVIEYRQGGQLYAVRVVPQVGPPYWLVDGDGDGRLETRYSELAPGFLIPSWVLFSW